MTSPSQPDSLQDRPAAGAEPSSAFGTDALLADLGARSTRGGVVMIASEAAQLLLGFVSTIVLARLLVPEDFGLVAMVASVMAFVGTLRDFGLPMAAVQRPSLTHAELSGLFWLNLKLATLVALVLCALAPGISWFYRDARLTGITLVLTAGVFAAGASTVHAGLLRRRMRFGAITAIELTCAAAGVAVAIVSARLGGRFWALVLQQLVTNLTTAAGLWIVSRWRPSRPTHAPEGVRSMVSYGKYLTWARAVNYVGKNLDVVLLGKFAGPGAAGLYQKAEQWAGLTFQQVYAPLTDVLVSSFSRLQPDPPRYRIYFRRALLGLYTMTAPAMALAAVEAREVILLLLGARWVSAVPIFRAMAACALLGSTAQVARWIYLAEGKTRRQWRWSLISTPVLIAGVLAGLRWGAVGVSVGYTVATALLAYPALRFCLRGSVLTTRDFLGGTWRPLLNAAIAGVALLLLRHFAPPLQHVPLRFVRDTCFLTSVYGACWFATPGARSDLREMLSLLRHLRSTKGEVQVT